MYYLDIAKYMYSPLWFENDNKSYTHLNFVYWINLLKILKDEFAHEYCTLTYQSMITSRESPQQDSHFLDFEKWKVINFRKL